MARLIYITNTSVDGFTTDREGHFDWSVPTAEYLATINAILRPVGTHLYGRRMYETMAVWDTALLDPEATGFTPGLAQYEREFAGLWRASDKIVFSTTLSHPTTPRTRVERAFDADRIRRLKQTSERDLTVGGPQLAATALAANLVDEIHLLIHPIIVGGGHPWLPSGLRLPLELVNERRLGGIAHLHYRLAFAV